MESIVLNPFQEAFELDESFSGVSSLLSGLDGKTVGLYSNVKLNSAEILEAIADELAKKFSFEVIRGFYDASKLMPEDAWGEIDKCDVVLLANGDCGSCSSSGIANAIELHKRGIPALLISTKPFYGVVQTMAELRGMPDIRWAVVDHPLGSLNEEGLRQRAVEAAQQFCEIMLEAPVGASAA